MKQLLGAVLVVTLAACGVDQGEEYRQGLPKADTVKMAVPEGSKALTGVGQRADGLEGDRAEYYGVTRTVSSTVNGATAAVLNLVHDIVKNPPTTVQNNIAIWGPHTDPLSPNTWKMTVKRTGNNAYSYFLEGRAKTETDAAFRIVLSGTHKVSGSELGTGSFLIDWDKAKELPEHGNDLGTAAVDYSREAGAPISVIANFSNARDASNGMRQDVKYKYQATPGQGGAMEFSVTKNITGGPALETMAVRSRWQETGAGRTDIKVTGGDVPVQNASGSECWDDGFASRFVTVSYDASKNYGQQSVCAFATAEYASL